MVFLSAYGISFLVRHFYPRLAFNWLAVFSINLAWVIFLLIVARTLGDLRLGLEVRGLWESLIYSGAVYSAASIILFAVASLLGYDPLSLLLRNAMNYKGTPWFQSLPRQFLPLAAFITWLLSGFLVFSLLVAYPYENMGRKNLPLVMLALILFYNLPLMTGEWKLDDIIFLGLIYPLIYSKTGNSLGLVLNYVALYEFPVAVSVLIGWGETAFWFFMAFRVTWSLICLFLSVYRLIRLFLRNRPS